MVFYHRYRKYIDNIIWIFGDKVLSAGILFLVTVIVARYLGPEQYGIYAYAVSLASLAAVVGHMGLSGLVVREIVRKPLERGRILGTAFGLKCLGMMVAYVALLLYGWFYEGIDSWAFIAIAIAGAGVMFKSTEVLDSWFQAFVQARYVTISRLAGVLTSAGFVFICVALGGGGAWLVGATVIQSVIVAVCLATCFYYVSGVSFRSWRFDSRTAKDLLSQAWTIYLGSLFAVIYLKVDQVMLRWYQGAESVGAYAVAAQISEAWYFVPTAIVASLFPKLIAVRERDERHFNGLLQKLFDLLFWLALVVAALITGFSEYLILMFFGEAYSAAAEVLVIHIWASLFIFLRAAFSKWILIEGALVFSLLTQGAGAVMNVGLNYIWIPSHGSVGAAYATLVSYAVASLISLAFYKKTRPVFFMMVKAPLAPAWLIMKAISR